VARRARKPSGSVKAAADAAERRSKGVKETKPRAPIDPPTPKTVAEALAAPVVKLDVGKKPLGRPPKLKDDPAVIEAIDGLARIQCTHKEAASFFRVSEPTWHAFLKRHKKAATAFEAGRDEGLTSLRRHQFAMAENNATMAIWLGKQYLGQKDKQEIEHGGSVQHAIEITIVDPA
jgi:hypothetical protein